MEAASFHVSFLDKKYPATYIADERVALSALSTLREHEGLLGVDIETQPRRGFESDSRAALSPYTGRIRLLQIFDGITVYVFDLNYLEEEMFLPLLESKRFVAHYAIFELSFFYMMGVRRMNIGCSLILTKLIFHATYATDEGLSASLEAITEKLFGIKISKALQTSAWKNDELTFEQVEYAALDAVLTYKVAERLSPALSKFSLERIYEITKRAQLPIVALSLNGIGMDDALHRSLIDVWRGKLYAAKKRVLEITGLPEITGAKLGRWLEENLDEQTIALWPRTESGKLATDADAFLQFSYLPVVAPFSEYQKLDKLSSTYGSKLLHTRSSVTGRLHASYNLCGARTGRLSSSKPNLQNFPRDKDLRKIFVPEEGFTFVCADYSMIEMRVAGEVSQDKMMLDAFKAGIDLHELTASKITGTPLKEISGKQRQLAKAFNFGLLFGLGANKFSHYAKKSYGVEVSKSDALNSIEIFRDTYSGYREWQVNQAEESATSLLVRTPSGKLRKLDPRFSYGASMNTPIQGGAAEVMLVALRNVYDRLPPDVGALSNCVHDEILLEVRIGREEEAKQILYDAMKDGFLSIFPNGITNGIVGEIGVGPSWGEAKT